jgi:hypothetical protein
MMIRHARQEDPYGCAIACVAMLTGATYGELRAEYLDGLPPSNFAHRRPLVDCGTTHPCTDGLLARRGFAVARVWVSGFNASPVPDPWADAHMVSLQLPVGQHCIVLLRDGTVLDPAKDAPGRWESYRLYPVDYVAAVVPVHQARAA